MHFLTLPNISAITTTAVKNSNQPKAILKTAQKNKLINLLNSNTAVKLQKKLNKKLSLLKTETKDVVQLLALGFENLSNEEADKLVNKTLIMANLLKNNPILSEEQKNTVELSSLPLIKEKLKKLAQRLKNINNDKKSYTNSSLPFANKAKNENYPDIATFSSIMLIMAISLQTLQQEDQKLNLPTTINFRLGGVSSITIDPDLKKESVSDIVSNKLLLEILKKNLSNLKFEQDNLHTPVILSQLEEFVKTMQNLVKFKNTTNTNIPIDKKPSAKQTDSNNNTSSKEIAHPLIFANSKQTKEPLKTLKNPPQNKLANQKSQKLHDQSISINPIHVEETNSNNINPMNATLENNTFTHNKKFTQINQQSPKKVSAQTEASPSTISTASSNNADKTFSDKTKKTPEIRKKKSNFTNFSKQKPSKDSEHSFINTSSINSNRELESSQYIKLQHENENLQISQNQNITEEQIQTVRQEQIIQVVKEFVKQMEPYFIQLKLFNGDGVALIRHGDNVKIKIQTQLEESRLNFWSRFVDSVREEENLSFEFSFGGQQGGQQQESDREQSYKRFSGTLEDIARYLEELEKEEI